VEITIALAHGCSAKCRENSIAKSQEKINTEPSNFNLNIELTNGETLQVSVTFVSSESSSAGKAFDHLFKIK